MPSKSNVIVSQRGQITLPSKIRKRLGLKDGGVLTIEERQGEIVLHPATILEVELYSNEQISEWTEQDKLDETTREKVTKKLSKK